ncbi:hypothetical protein ABZX92_15680 [Lentzea sp. NPDC006480]|uniref:hypothetical protein n=1 Tax=Lentzea sp. NPDC006480 TaxID=3157176 RepID=UPI0033A94FDF
MTDFDAAIGSDHDAGVTRRSSAKPGMRDVAAAASSPWASGGTYVGCLGNNGTLTGPNVDGARFTPLVVSNKPTRR